jgi:lysophospholipase L1-like esterase
VSFGDSIAQGFYSSSFATNGFFNKLVLALQNQYGDGGSGACSVINTNGLIPGSAGNITASGSGGNAVGGFDAFAIGLNGYALYPNTPGSGAALTFTGIRGTTVQVVNYPTGYAGTMTVSVDGGAPTTISGSTGGSAVAMGVTNIAATAGVHIVVVTFNSGTAILADVRGLNNDGIVGYGMNHYGRSSGDVRTTTYLSSTPLMGNICIEAFAPDLFIFEEGINDIGYDVLGITYAYNVACAMDFARAGNPLCDIVIVAPHRGNTPDLAELYPAYIGELRAVAESYGAMLVDFWPIGRNSYPFWSSLGYFGDGTNDGLAGSNPVHPSDAGHAFMESVLTPLLT